jgi:hypothetical protein
MEMKEYKTPEMEVVKLAYNTALLSDSDPFNENTDMPIEGEGGGSGPER